MNTCSLFRLSGETFDDKLGLGLCYRSSDPRAPGTVGTGQRRSTVHTQPCGKMWSINARAIKGSAISRDNGAELPLDKTLFVAVN